MRKVDQHAEVVHPVDHVDAEVAQAAVDPFRAPGTERVELVVAELDLTDANRRSADRG